MLNGRGVSTAEDCKAYFSPRHVCEVLGVSWPRQFRKIMEDHVLEGVVAISETTGRDGKTSKMSMLPIEFANCGRNDHGYHWRLMGTFEMRYRNGNAASRLQSTCEDHG